MTQYAVLATVAVDIDATDEDAAIERFTHIFTQVDDSSFLITPDVFDFHVAQVHG